MHRMGEVPWNAARGLEPCPALSPRLVPVSQGGRRRPWPGSSGASPSARLRTRWHLAWASCTSKDRRLEIRNVSCSMPIHFGRGNPSRPGKVRGERAALASSGPRVHDAAKLGWLANQRRRTAWHGLTRQPYPALPGLAGGAAERCVVPRGSHSRKKPRGSRSWCRPSPAQQPSSPAWSSSFSLSLSLSGSAFASHRCRLAAHQLFQPRPPPCGCNLLPHCPLLSSAPSFSIPSRSVFCLLDRPFTACRRSEAAASPARDDSSASRPWTSPRPRNGESWRPRAPSRPARARRPRPTRTMP